MRTLFQTLDPFEQGCWVHAELRLGDTHERDFQCHTRVRRVTHLLHGVAQRFHGSHKCRSTKLIVTYHPAYLLRDPRQKKEAWQDLKLAMAELGLSVPSR